MGNNYDELLKQYHALLQENERLQAENHRLHVLLERCRSSVVSDISPDAEETISPPPVEDHVCASKEQINRFSSPEEKISLFRSLFIGREDVFARRWVQRKTGKSGYQPVCKNEWTELCEKKTNKCAVCPNRELLPLTDADVFRHLAGKDADGRDVIGIYPLLPDDTCRFLCVDFDESSYREDVLALADVCKGWGIPVSVERSRSGNGAHVWMFFSEPIAAASARKLGTLILTKAMENRSDLSFGSYDRLFPNQDTIPKGGFGNLIALPLQGQARRNGNSVFVDSGFIPYPDQWAYLSGIERLSEQDVDRILAQYDTGNELGELVHESDEKPWETKKPTSLTNNDIPKDLSIVRANQLYIPRAHLTARAENAIKRLAAFSNPDFYRAQAMRLPIYNKPRVISCAELTEDYITFPRGCERALMQLLDSANAQYVWEDHTYAGTSISVRFNGTLREEQQSAADAMLMHKNGVLAVPTAFGKTVIASYLISQRKVNTLVLVHTQALLTQWQKALEQFLLLEAKPPEQKHGRGRKRLWSPVGTLGSNRDDLHGAVDVAILQSCFDRESVKTLVRDYGMVIVDECHHVSAVSFERVLKQVCARYVYGLTATPTRQDGQHPIIFMQCGPIRYRVSAKAQAEKRPFEHTLLPRFTEYRSASDRTITQHYKALAENAARNKLIVEDVAFALHEGRTPIVLTERREHVSLLCDALKPHCENVIALVGTSSVKERRETMERLSSIPADEPLVVIATGKYVGEGFDCPRLDTLFLTLPIAWKGTIAQYAGRLHRDYIGKKEVRIYDYVDLHIPMLERMYQKRLKGYAAIGYQAQMNDSGSSEPNLIYDGQSYDSIFRSDITGAKKELWIASPNLKQNRIRQLMPILSQLVANGVAITVFTHTPDIAEKEHTALTESITYLRSYGIQVKTRDNLFLRCAVIDSEIVWYGSVNVLSYNSHEACIMRLENSKIAAQLLDSVMK